MGKNQKKDANMESTTDTNTNSSMKVQTLKRTRKSAPRDAPSQRSSVYRGVTRHRWTGRFEAHLWDKCCWNESQNKKGKQVYLGAHDDEEAAAHAYDLAALKYWGHETILNFPLSTYQEELEQMERQSREEYIGALRRKSSGFSRGVSKYRGVARHHHNGRWEARLGRVLGNKYMYLGTYATQEEAAIAYDMAAIEYRGLNAVTNFDLSRYTGSSCGDQIVDAAATSMSCNDSSMDDLGFSFQLQDQQHFTEAISQLPVANYVSSSACELLLQPLKFQEMSERTSAASSSSLSFSPPSICGSIPSGCSFRDDLQTYFECHDGGNFTEEEDSIFGGLNALMSPLFKYELGTRGHLSYTHG